MYECMNDGGKINTHYNNVWINVCIQSVVDAVVHGS